MVLKDERMHWYLVYVLGLIMCILVAVEGNNDMDLDSTHPQIIFFTTVRPFKPTDDQNEKMVSEILLSFWASYITDSIKLVIFSEDNYTRGYINQKHPQIIISSDFTLQKKSYGITILWKSLYATIGNMFPTADVLVYFNGDIIWNDNMIKTLIKLHRTYHGKTRFCATGYRRNIDVVKFLSKIENSLKWQYFKQIDPNEAFRELKDITKPYKLRGFDLFACSSDALEWEYAPEFVIPLVCGDLWPTCQVQRAGSIPGLAIEIGHTAPMIHLSAKEIQQKNWKALENYNCDLLAEVDAFYSDDCNPRHVLQTVTYWKHGEIHLEKRPKLVKLGIVSPDRLNVTA